MMCAAHHRLHTQDTGSQSRCFWRRDQADRASGRVVPGGCIKQFFSSLIVVLGLPSWHDVWIRLGQNYIPQCIKVLGNPHFKMWRMFLCIRWDCLPLNFISASDLTLAWVSLHCTFLCKDLVRGIHPVTMWRNSMKVCVAEVDTWSIGRTWGLQADLPVMWDKLLNSLEPSFSYIKLYMMFTQ